MKKSQDEKSWLLGMIKLLWLHDYSMKAMITTSVLKEKHTFGGKM